MRRTIPLAAALLLLAACGGGGTALQGTFREIMYDTAGSHTPCAAQEFSNDPAAIWKVRVTADNVNVGTVPVHWTGNAAGNGCVATWSISVPAAQKAYQVTLLAVCNGLTSSGTESIASATVQPSAAGQPVRFSDASSGGNNC